LTFHLFENIDQKRKKIEQNRLRSTFVTFSASFFSSPSRDSRAMGIVSKNRHVEQK